MMDRGTVDHALDASYPIRAAEASSPFDVLDQLYSHVLGQAFPNIKPHIPWRLKTVLGSIVLLQDPITLARVDTRVVDAR